MKSWLNLSKTLRRYIYFCLAAGAFMVYANHIGWFPTYGIFSGENSSRSGSHGGYHGYSGIHGK